MLKSVFIPNRYNSYVWVNVIGLIALLYFGKIEPYTVLFGYFLETIIIGIFNVFKMMLASKHDKTGQSRWFLIPFFMFHYGMFVAIQSIFAFVVINMAGNSFIKEPFHLIENYITVLSFEGIQYVLPLLVGTQIMKFVFDYILPKKYMEFTASEIMTKPYLRIFIQQFTVIFAMFFIIFSNAETIAAILLIFFRTGIDFFIVGIRENQLLLNTLVDKLYDGETSKEDMKKQLILFSE